MKIKLKIIPLIGIEINDSKITFGSNINEIIKILGEPDYKNERQLYYDTLEFSDHFVIRPSTPSFGGDYEKNMLGDEGHLVPDGFAYDSGSNSHFLTVEELREMNP